MSKQTDLRTKEYPSLFLAESKINLPNFLTEIVMVNFLNWQKIPKPTSPFWRKDIPKDARLTELAKRYNLELIAIQQLLKVFREDILAKFLVANNVAIIKWLTKPKQQEFVYNLYQFSLKVLKEKQEVEISFEEPIVEHYTKKTFVTKENALI